MTPDEFPGDPVLAALKNLLAWDVDERRAQRLRVRCHGARSVFASAATGRSRDRAVRPLLPPMGDRHGGCTSQVVRFWPPGA
jgi:hypothetical protein